MEIIFVDPKKCINCHACTRACPVPESCIQKVSQDGKQYTGIDPEKCIHCGNCIPACPHKARDYNDDYEDFIEDMYSKKGKISLLIAPSIKVAFKDVWQDVLRWFYAQGIRKIYDVSFGADIATWAQLRLINTKSTGKYISSSCASVVSYAQKHNSELLEKLSPVYSPESCMAIYARKYLKDPSEFAYIGPCFSRKEEFEENGLIKYCVTFNRLKQYFEKRQHTFSNTGQGGVFEFTHKQGLMGALYASTGGIKTNMLLYKPDLSIACADGDNEIYSLMDRYLQLTENKKPDILELNNCHYGCCYGNGMGESVSITDMSAAMDLARRDAEKRCNGLFNINKNDKLFKEFDKDLKLEVFCRKFVSKQKYLPHPTPNDLNNIFTLMLKNSSNERSINCGACGHKNCGAMATAIFHGSDVKENCIYYSRNLPGNDSAQKSLADTGKFITENVTLINENIASIRQEAVSIFSNNSKTADAAKTINSVIEQMIEACNNPNGISQNTLTEICSTLELIRKILLNLGKFVTKNSESGYTIDKCVTTVENTTAAISEMINDTIKK